MTKQPRLYALALLTLTVACAGKAPGAQPAGVLTVGISTTGSNVGALSFQVEIKRTPSAADTLRADRIKADGGLATFRDLPDGSYVVGLTLPSQCQPTNGASRPITIVPRRTTAVRFAVTCR
jgi:hypothetical protein